MSEPVPSSRSSLATTTTPRAAGLTVTEPRTVTPAARPSRPRARTTMQEPERAMTDVQGALFLVAGIIYLLALYSFDPKDLPSWFFLNPTDSQNVNPVNFIGKAGAMGAAVSISLMGMCTFLIPLSFIWFGVGKVTSKAPVTGRSWLGVVLMVLSGTAILELTGIDFGQDAITPHGGGGALGHLIGGVIFHNVLGQVGSMLVLGTVYCIGIIFTTGFHPLDVLSGARAELPGAMASMAAWWGRFRSSEQQVVEEAAPVAAKRTARGKSPTPSSIGASTATEPPTAEALETMELGLQYPPPEPKIIDASAPKIPDKNDPRPSLADVLGQKRAQKMKQTGAAPMGSLTDRYKEYQLPALDLLSWPDPSQVAPTDPTELKEMQDVIVRTLGSFGISVSKGDITRGPAITRYEVRPVDGLRVSRIAQLDADLARATKAERINILAPIPGKDTVGIEIANKNKVVVPIRELLEDDLFQNGKARLPLALGKDVYGKAIIADLAAMPHLLVAGATGSGKSVCINSIIASLICRFAPDELRFVLVDPKVVEMQAYGDLPHLALPVVTDPKKALLALRWVVREMETRYQIFAQEGCRNFETFNNRNRKKKAPNRDTPEVASKTIVSANEPPPIPDHFLPELKEEGSPADDPSLYDSNGQWAGDSLPPSVPHRSQEQIIPDTMPYIVVIIDELADLMQTAPADIEGAIARITQMARAAGIHLILATQTPRVDVITGVIKANVPSRIAFQVASSTDSRVILDRKGAENLVGKGDMLYLPPGTAAFVRSQGALVTDDEIHALIEHCVGQGKPLFDQEGESMATKGGFAFGDEEEEEEQVSSEDERTLERCLEVIRQEKKCSTSMLQRRLGIGYGKAARMLDILEDRGIVGPGDGAKPREILVRMD
jgi:DNA segregation ATPase FtsK/SpoIIIE, S-DNA-T family